MSNRISQCFDRAKQADRAVLGIFVSAGDPTEQASTAILDSLVENGADFIELGMPFSDPMADGPAIQAASLRNQARHDITRHAGYGAPSGPVIPIRR